MTFPQIVRKLTITRHCFRGRKSLLLMSWTDQEGLGWNIRSLCIWKRRSCSALYLGLDVRRASGLIIKITSVSFQSDTFPTGSQLQLLRLDVASTTSLKVQNRVVVNNHQKFISSRLKVHLKENGKSTGRVNCYFCCTKSNMGFSARS